MRKTRLREAKADSTSACVKMSTMGWGAGVWGAAGALIQAGLTPNEYPLTTSESAMLELDSSSCGNSFCYRQQQGHQIAP